MSYKWNGSDHGHALPGGDSLHHDSGEHRLLPAGSNGRAVEIHERALRHHLALHETHQLARSAVK